jgi:hypothetical protein
MSKKKKDPLLDEIIEAMDKARQRAYKSMKPLVWPTKWDEIEGNIVISPELLKEHDLA